MDKLRFLATDGQRSLAQAALRFVLDEPAVSVAIPGAKTPEQARANAGAIDLTPLSDETLARVRELYVEYAKPLVHQRW